MSHFDSTVFYEFESIGHQKFRKHFANYRDVALSGDTGNAYSKMYSQILSKFCKWQLGVLDKRWTANQEDSGSNPVKKIFFLTLIAVISFILHLQFTLTGKKRLAIAFKECRMKNWKKESAWTRFKPGTLGMQN